MVWRLGLYMVTLGAAVIIGGCGKIFEDSSVMEPAPASYVVEPWEGFTNERSASDFVEGCRTRMRDSRVVKRVAPKNLSDGPYHWSTIAYTLDARSETIQLIATLTLDLTAIPSGERESYRERIDTIRQCMRDFYLRHDIFLQLDFVEPGAALAASVGDAAYVVFRKNGVRVSSYNMSNWAFAMDDQPLSDSIACTVMAHEFGHMLGLRDEYEDPSIRHRPLGASDSVMRACHMPASEAKLYPSHLKTILRSGCDDPAAMAEIRRSPKGSASFPPF